MHRNDLDHDGPLAAGELYPDPEIPEPDADTMYSDAEDYSSFSDDEELEGFDGAAAAYLRQAHEAYAELQQALIESGLTPVQQVYLHKLVEEGHHRAATVIQALQAVHEEQAEAEAVAAMTPETEEFLRTAEQLREKLNLPLYPNAEINTLLAMFSL